MDVDFNEYPLFWRRRQMTLSYRQILDKGGKKSRGKTNSAKNPFYLRLVQDGTIKTAYLFISAPVISFGSAADGAIQQVLSLVYTIRVE